MAPTPAWVLKDLVNVTGFDNETVGQQILPYLESFASSVKLRRHLEEFIGSSPAAVTFTDKYVNLRFPSRPTPPPFMEHRNDLRAKVAPSNPSSKAASPSTSRIPSPQPPSRASSSDKLTSQFGTNGKVYMKNQDLPEWSGISKKHSGSGVASPNLNMLGSGSSTPVTRGHSPAPGVPVRSKAIEIREAKAKKSKAGTVASGSDQDIARSEKVYPKSKETKVLEARIRALRGETTTDNDVETLPEFVQCYCQARSHPLSPYTPSCVSCGLILCRLQQPHQPCPSCDASLLSAPQRDRLIAKLYAEIEAVMAREQTVRDEREQARRERMLAESGGGHFPTLNGKPIVSTAANRPEARKVLTLGAAGKGKGKGRATMTTYSTPASSSAVSPNPSPAPSSAPIAAAETTISRPREGPLDAKRLEKEWAKVAAWRKEEDRPWGNPKAQKDGDAWVYTPKPVLELMLDHEELRREARRKKGSLASQGIGLDGRKVPGAA